MIKREYNDIQEDDENFDYGYKRFEGHETPMFWMATDDEQITLKLSPSHLRKLAMRLIKLSYRVDAK